MTPEDPGTRNAKLPRRDWFLLPAIGIVTILLLASSSEFLAKLIFPVSQSGLDHCFAKPDPTGDSRVLPNSSYSEQIAESRYVADYKFNNCGDRATMECGPKAPGTYRIVLIGSSIPQGLYVPLPMTFAATLPGKLSQLTGRKVEIYNEATGGKYRGGPTPARDLKRQIDAVTAADPDLILWMVTPLDMANPAFEDPTAEEVLSAPVPAQRHSFAGKYWDKVSDWITKGTLIDEIRYRWEETRVSLALKHYLFSSESQHEYVNSYLRNPVGSDFLKTNPSQLRLHLQEHFDQAAAEYEARAKATGVPFVAVLAPNRAQVAMISTGDWPHGYDPYKVDADLHRIIESHGGICIDILPDFRLIPNPERHFFPVDGHVDADGHAILSDFLAKELTSGAIPALKAGAQSQAAAEAGK